MQNIEQYYKGHSTAESRWARFGPYYAMFPVDFAFNIVNTHSKKGDKIIDPFCGRGSSIFAGSVLGRKCTGIEINPLGWIYSQVKLKPAKKENVLKRLKDIYDLRTEYEKAILNYDKFFRMCFCDEVLKFLLSARDNLNWKKNQADKTLIAFISVYLHARIGEGLSNQMRQTKAMGINYSIDWWKKNGFENPPEINPYMFLKDKIEWRYSKGIHIAQDSNVKLGDSCTVTEKLVKSGSEKFSLLFTSPPYLGVTNYFVDQWLRMWLLGGPEKPVSETHIHKRRFNNKEQYEELLDTVFGNCAKMMKQKSCIYVRTDSRDYTFNTTKKILQTHFPNHKIYIENQPIAKDVKTQTEILGNTSKKPGEIDIILKSD